jgi:hypothetical protein
LRLLALTVSVVVFLLAILLAAGVLGIGRAAGRGRRTGQHGFPSLVSSPPTADVAARARCDVVLHQ